MQSQGIPFVFPLDQDRIVAAIQHETKLSTSLYEALGKDTKDLSKKIAGEISRGFSNAAPVGTMSRNIANHAGISRNNAMRIARTESHRIQCTSGMDALKRSKNSGADVVKQWDASLDDRTRDAHRQLDGQIREIDEPFEVAGMTAMYPGGFGVAHRTSIAAVRCYQGLDRHLIMTIPNGHRMRLLKYQMMAQLNCLRLRRRTMKNSRNNTIRLLKKSSKMIV